MSKNTKVTMSQKAVATPEEHDAHIDEILAEFGATVENPDLQLSKESVDKIEKAIKAPKAAPEVKAVDLTAILAAIPDTFTPALLDKAFNLNDGGKTVRRHLRNHFAEEMSHNKKDKWTFTKADNQTILAYFASKYAFNAKAIA